MQQRKRLNWSPCLHPLSQILWMMEPNATAPIWNHFFLLEKGLALAHNYRLQFIIAEKLQQQEPEAAGHISSVLDQEWKENECMGAVCSLVLSLASPLLQSAGLLTREWCRPLWAGAITLIKTVSHRHVHMSVHCRGPRRGVLPKWVQAVLDWQLKH